MDKIIQPKRALVWVEGDCVMELQTRYKVVSEPAKGRNGETGISGARRYRKVEEEEGCRLGKWGQVNLETGEAGIRGGIFIRLPDRFSDFTPGFIDYH